MGLDISVGDKRYYSHSYHCIHELRLFAAQKEYPIVTNLDEIYKIFPSFTRFKALINHSDAEYGYLPAGIEPPYKADDTDISWQWQSSEELLKELEDLGQYEITDEHLKSIYSQLFEAAKASVAENKAMEFH
jgi:hypothetical protein